MIGGASGVPEGYSKRDECLVLPRKRAGGCVYDHSKMNAIENVVSFPVTFSQDRA